jgi:hypothetical protein
MKIYLDLDGVLANFDKRYEELFGVRPKETRQRRRHFWNNWETFINGKNFETLDLMPDATELLVVVESLKVPIEILTSSGGHQYHEEVKQQKINWLKNKGIPYKPNVVPGGVKKAEFAAPWNILIDDTEKVIEAYRKAGGTAILHKNVAETISALYKLHLEWQNGE